MSLNARLMGRILSVQKILVGGIEQTPEGAVTDGKVTPYILIRGSTGNDAIVDSNGNLVCMLKGDQNLPIAQDASGNMVSVIKGSEDLIIAQDTSGNMIAAMKGLEGANVRDIAVDVNGNMVAVMKGDYGGVLDTIALDDHGRMLSIVTDPEDVRGKSHGIGMAEAVSRLGSNMRFERRGNVLFVDDFESSTLKYSNYTAGSSSTAARCTDTALNGDFSVKCVTGANTSHHAGISYTINNYHVSKVGAEISFATSDAKVDTILSMVYTANNRYYKASLKFDNYTNLLYYLDDANAWQNAVPSSLWYERGIRSWATMKLVIDLSTKKYVRGFVTRDESDLSTYDIFNANSANEFLTINVYIKPSENVAKTAYLDNFVLTENEPA